MAKFETLAAIPINILTTGQLDVTSNNTVYTETFVLTRHRCFSLELLFSSDTDVNVRVELEQGNYKPAAERVSSFDYVSTLGVVATILDENVHIIPISPVVSVYARLKLTGINGNSITTKLVRANWVEVES